MLPEIIHLLLLVFLILSGCQAKRTDKEAVETSIPVITAKATNIRSANEISLNESDFGKSRYDKG